MENTVAIVGAGPGGCATAIACCQYGIHATLFEGSPFPRDSPGETLHPGVETLFRQLGVAEAVLGAGFIRHAGHTVAWLDAPRFVPFGSDASGPWLGFQAVRAKLDALLLERARTLGVEIRQPCRVLEPILSGNRVRGVRTSGGDVACSFLVDAGGRSHWLARRLNLPIRTYSPPLTAYYGYRSGACPVRDDAPALHADRDGWTWVARVAPALYQWTRLNVRRQPLPEGWIPDELQPLEPRGKTRMVDVTWRMVDPAAGPGYFLVGDAAAVLDPASSHGVLKALAGGIMAAHLIRQVLDHGAAEPDAAQAYDKWLQQQVRYDITGLRKLYAIFTNE